MRCPVRTPPRPHPRPASPPSDARGPRHQQPSRGGLPQALGRRGAPPAGPRRLAGGAPRSRRHSLLPGLPPPPVQVIDIGGCYNISTDALDRLLTRFPNAARIRGLHLSGCNLSARCAALRVSQCPRRSKQAGVTLRCCPPAAWSALPLTTRRWRSSRSATLRSAQTRHAGGPCGQPCCGAASQLLCAPSPCPSVCGAGFRGAHLHPPFLQAPPPQASSPLVAPRHVRVLLSPPPPWP